MTGLAKYVYEYALKNYNKSGWSTVVECYELEEIESVLAEENAKTKKEALAAFKDLVDIWGERMDDSTTYK